MNAPGRFFVLLAAVLTGMIAAAHGPVALASAGEEERVVFQDENLKERILRSLGLEGEEVTAAQMETLTAFDGTRGRIASLEGLEHAVNLEHLRLRDNHLTDISPLAGLTALRHLDLRGNRVEDISVLANMDRLEVLGLRDNLVSDLSPLLDKRSLARLDLRNNRGVTDISPLAWAPSLTELNLRDTRVEDLGPLAKLTLLRSLYLRNNRYIADVSALGNLVNLEWLHLRDNRVADIRPLVGLPELRYLNLFNNQVPDITVLNTLPKLETANVNLNQLNIHNHAPTLFTVFALHKRGVNLSFQRQRRSAANRPPPRPGEAFFAASAELILKFDDTGREIVLDLDSQNNTARIPEPELAGGFDYQADGVDTVSLLITFPAEDGDSDHRHELRLTYEDHFSGRFEGLFHGGNPSGPVSRSGSFHWR